MRDRERDALSRLIAARRAAWEAGRRTSSPPAPAAPATDIPVPESGGEPVGGRRVRNRNPLRAVAIAGITVLSVVLVGPPQASEKLTRAYGSTASTPKLTQQPPELWPGDEPADVEDVDDESSAEDGTPAEAGPVSETEDGGVADAAQAGPQGRGGTEGQPEPSTSSRPQHSNETTRSSGATGSAPEPEPDDPVETPEPSDPVRPPDADDVPDDPADAGGEEGLCVSVDLLSIVDLSACTGDLLSP